jgi:hypothetical protein
MKNPSTPIRGGSTKSPVKKGQSKKIVNQRQVPWGLIGATVLVVALAVGVIGYAILQGKKKEDDANPAKIAGIERADFTGGQHQEGLIKYKQSPPIGGPHNPYWADCTGTVYPRPIANENAVHSLEHGAVWITYKPGLANDQLDALSKLVGGQQFMLMSPYPGLKSNVSLQSWGSQLFVDSATDPRVKRFVVALRQNKTSTPELGASCDNAAFKTSPSTPGKPFAPKS